MPKNLLFLPEGSCPPDVVSVSALREAADSGAVLEAPVLRCDTKHNLHLKIGALHAIMPRQEVTAPWISGSNREIAVLSRVGKQTCFTVKSVGSDEKGSPVITVSRKDAQEKAMDWFLQNLLPGDVLTCKITRLDSFGAFLDIGRGIIAMLPLESLSVSRISHPKVRFREGQTILAVVAAIDPLRKRITMTHKELLGTWMENAAMFSPGETVQGVVRSIRDYGSFIELAPNLSGLTDAREGFAVGDRVSVYLKSIRPERMKIKLQVIENLGPETEPAPPRYQITDGHLDHWIYSPPNYEKEPVETIFTVLSP